MPSELRLRLDTEATKDAGHILPDEQRLAGVQNVLSAGGIAGAAPRGVGRLDACSTLSTGVLRLVVVAGKLLPAGPAANDDAHNCASRRSKNSWFI
jgi:hypothetical protein